jgi:cobalamin biosynthesis Mg chelatase CobN
MNYLQKTATLGLVQALVDHCRPPQGRFAGLLRRLGKEAGKEFAKLPRLSDSDMKRAEKAIVELGERTGWEGKGKHPATIVSFLLAAIDEERGFDGKIVEVLNELHAYMEHGKSRLQPCCWAGARAAEIWLEVSGKL